MAPISNVNFTMHPELKGPPWSEGRLSAVSMIDGHLKVASDPRSGQAYAVGQ